MTSTAAPSPRIQRIRQAARDMALRGGLQGITIAEIARRAGVGKGTVYLYWTTKEDLFADLFAEDFLDALAEVEAAVREDPGLVVPRRLLPLVGRSLDRHPFVAAVQSSGAGLLGVIATHPAIVQGTRDVGPVAVLARVFPVLREHGVIRSDLDSTTQVHATAALLHGLLGLDEQEPVADLLPGSDPQEVLSAACAALLEPAEAVDPGPAANAALTEMALARDAALEGLRGFGLGAGGAHS